MWNFCQEWADSGSHQHSKKMQKQQQTIMVIVTLVVLVPVTMVKDVTNNIPVRPFWILSWGIWQSPGQDQFFDVFELLFTVWFFNVSRSCEYKYALIRLWYTFLYVCICIIHMCVCVCDYLCVCVSIIPTEMSIPWLHTPRNTQEKHGRWRKDQIWWSYQFSQKNSVCHR